MQDEIFAKLKKALPGIKKNVLLKKHTTFKIGGPAKYFLVVPTPKNRGSRIRDGKAIGTSMKEQIIKALTLAQSLKIRTFILGGGSNMLASDKGFDGLVIKIENKKFIFKVKKDNTVTIPAGVQVAKIVAFSTQKGLDGWQWAGGLPGTLGGAIRGNAGAFGGETKDTVLVVEGIEDDTLQVRTFSNAQCRFSYRNSIFKQKNWIVLSVTLQFKLGDKKELQKIAKANMDYRKERHPLDLPNAGSIFKNCDVKEFSPSLQQSLAQVVKKDPFPVVPVAYLLSQIGLKGTTIGGAQVSPKHPNFIVNIKNAKAEDVLKIIDVNKEHIKKNYGVNLEQEVQYLD